ncbi:kinase [Magnetospirillum sp. UT-4]|uniref:GHMP family kinase ATP-binding protein n=1 Tax=Magnetospirillum sp. UT-4 TaxID=2681467 RepID=UPI001C2D1300|nr:kinase [Magnetospirillum sp. UT-4]
MAISRTPYRVSFFGGGSDYPAWYLREGGAVLSSTINQYCFLSCRTMPPFFNSKYRVIWSHIEICNSISEILHPAVREGLRALEFDESHGLEIQYQGDLPARSGMGSSSAFAVGLIKSLLSLRDIDVNRHELAMRAIDLEQNWLKDSVGSQDQVAAAYGGLNVIRFQTDGRIRVEPIVLRQSVKDQLAAHMVLIFTGASRLGSEVAQTVIGNLDKKPQVIREMHAMVDLAADALLAGDIDSFGRMLHESWMLKRSISDMISNDHINEIYETARAHGATGGKLLGAGRSGFMLLFIPPERRDEVLKALKHFLHVPFNFDESGCQIIYRSPE